MAGTIGERSDAVLRTAMPGHDKFDLTNSIFSVLIRPTNGLIPRVGSIVGMLGTLHRGPGRAEVGELDFQALDRKPQRAAAREREDHGAARRIVLVELHGEQIEHRILVLGTDVAALQRKRAVEAKGGAAAAIARLA